MDGPKLADGFSDTKVRSRAHRNQKTHVWGGGKGLCLRSAWCGCTSNT